jgi:hypothetical protein
MVSAKVARHTRLKNADVAECGRFDVTRWGLTRNNLRTNATNERPPHFRLTQ